MNSIDSPLPFATASVYQKAYDEGRKAVRPNQPYINPYVRLQTGSDHDRHYGFHDGFRGECIRQHLSFPDCKPFARLPFPDDE